MIDTRITETDPERILSGALETLRGRIAANIISAGANASGSTIASLEVDVTGGASGWTGTLSGRPFFGALETGSRPWRNQYAKPPRFFVDIIQDWIDAKGLDLSAFLVARKIMRTGSALYRDGGRDTIYSKEIPETVREIQEKILLYWQVKAVQNIKLNG